MLAGTGARWLYNFKQGHYHEQLTMLRKYLSFLCYYVTMARIRACKFKTPPLHSTCSSVPRHDGAQRFEICFWVEICDLWGLGVVLLGRLYHTSPAIVRLDAVFLEFQWKRENLFGRVIRATIARCQYSVDIVSGLINVDRCKFVLKVILIFNGFGRALVFRTIWNLM